MNFWLLIWVFVVVFICGIFVWSAQILFKQKKAWIDFAKKHTMDYARNSLMKSPVLNGLFRGFPLTIYSEEQPTADQRGRRFRTILQFELPGGMPVEGIVASEANHAFAQSLIDLTERYMPPLSGFPETVLIKTRSIELLEPYMTEERVRALQALMTIKSINAMFIFDLGSTYLRFETPDPMADTAKLERLATKIAEQAKILALK